MTKSDFTYEIDGDNVRITDLNQGRMSVTNDIENVISQIEKKVGYSLHDKVVTYQDSSGDCDGIHFKNGSVDFIFLGTNNLQFSSTLMKSFLKHTAKEDENSNHS